jgi:hypothetical protein
MLGIADADDDDDDDDDFDRWHALQRWIELGDHRVTIPYRRRLAELIPPKAVRLRRDFKALLTLIKAHALLHQANRLRDGRGRIVAVPDDYAVVRELVAELVAEGVKSTVSEAVRETVAAVKGLDKPSIAQVGRHLKLDTSAASRRVKRAISNGYLRNEESRRGHPAQLVVGDPLPDDVELLPNPAALEDPCTHACDSEGMDTPPPPDETEDDLEAFMLKLEADRRDER